ncbi:MAG TPA: hypothetical protein PLJ34_02855 [Hyphomicrobiales bacterium]|nr:hypothetical protein [Hyphomicrobiales bacterium]
MWLSRMYGCEAFAELQQRPCPAKRTVGPLQPALAVGQRLVERRHGAGNGRVVVVDPDAEDAGPGEHQALDAEIAAQAGGADAGTGEHPGLRVHRDAAPGKREERIAGNAAVDRLQGGLMGRQRLDAAHHHVEQALARALLGHVGIDIGEHRLVDAGGEGGEDVELGGEGAAQGGERDAGACGDLGQADLLERLLGGERQQRVDDFLAGLFGRHVVLPWLIPVPKGI